MAEHKGAQRLSVDRASSVASLAPPLVVVEKLVKRFGDKVVLDGFDLTIARGETCVIIGGSGSGKSTFARLLVGLDRPDEGAIRVGGVDITQLDERELGQVRRKFAMVFQKYALLDSLTVFDNVAFPMREERRLAEPEIEERAHRALKSLDVDDAWRKLPGELSGGMAKRVGIARAVVTEPEIIVYDEPTSGLDPVSARVVDELIGRMRTKYAVTSVVITHDMVSAYEIADRVVVLAEGRAVAAGPPYELFRSHGEYIEPFAVSSGIDIAHLAPPKARESVATVSARWDAAHPRGAEHAARAHWHFPWSKP